MDVLNIAGIVLQVIGVAVAIAGVSRLHRDLTSRSVGDALRAEVVDKWRAWRSRKHARVRGVGTMSETASTAAGIGTMKPPTLPDDPAEQIAYLDRMVMALFDLQKSQRKWAKGEHDRLRSEANASAERLGGEIGEVERLVSETREAITGGPSGAGLRLAAGGLAVTILGLLLTLVAAV